MFVIESAEKQLHGRVSLNLVCSQEDWELLSKKGTDKLTDYLREETEEVEENTEVSTEVSFKVYIGKLELGVLDFRFDGQSVNGVELATHSYQYGIWELNSGSFNEVDEFYLGLNYLIKNGITFDVVDSKTGEVVRSNRVLCECPECGVETRE